MRHGMAHSALILCFVQMSIYKWLVAETSIISSGLQVSHGRDVLFQHNICLAKEAKKSFTRV
jgi:hypothetical protein